MKKQIEISAESNNQKARQNTVFLNVKRANLSIDPLTY